MDDLLPSDPSARRRVLVAWGVAAAIGTIAVWWLSTYVDALTALARTDRDAAMALFKSRIMPALVVVVLVAVVAGGLLLRQGVQMIRGGAIDRPSGGPESRTTSGPARAIGGLFAIAGLLMAAVPLALLTIVLWMLRRG